MGGKNDETSNRRQGERGYLEATPEALGWVYSNTLNLWFGEDATGRLRIHTPAGEMLLTHEEEARARHEAQTRVATAEQRIAELEAELQQLRTQSGGDGEE